MVITDPPPGNRGGRGLAVKVVTSSNDSGEADSDRRMARFTCKSTVLGGRW
ncbi:hypothetical protein ACFVIM_01590 [Streptomyces sp. NPDC057638]|uniref:hypothetical protein n=1 Tax=Streptomyces sp. NPDC057638 TaxID=3346190 RepID=UPI00367B41E1